MTMHGHGQGNVWYSKSERVVVNGQVVLGFAQVLIWSWSMHRERNWLNRDARFRSFPPSLSVYPKIKEMSSDQNCDKKHKIQKGDTINAKSICRFYPVLIRIHLCSFFQSLYTRWYDRYRRTGLYFWIVLVFLTFPSNDTSYTLIKSFQHESIKS